MAAPPLPSHRFLLDAFEPAYVALHRAGRLGERAEAARRALESCRLCPRGCEARRLEGRVGTCGVGPRAAVSSAFPHHGEEDCLRGGRGSGTVFFAGCGLRCAFCQNADVSWLRRGEDHDAEDLATIFLWLQERGCHNLNLVTPSHVVPQVLEAVAFAAGRGLRLPIVYNSSGYDSVGTLRLLDGVVDVYMPDFKFWRNETAERYAAAPDYPDRARAAILEMHRQTGPLLLGPDGLARRGLLVRHLVMPGLAGESAAIFDWLARAVSADTYVNVMGQYRPQWRVGEPDRGGRRLFAEIDRRPRAWEVEAAREAARRAGLWRLDAPRLAAPCSR
ncbi:MAG TPA: radical SAM protein [Vicinamibacteria bacterium]|nr:radical SAM protein [Vicinamibacteria bacterium]